ncbi:cation:proton antiporter [Micromonospora sonchi]|uniref:Cation:proton antiporter n=1 Tax=Micromonospora sonchi TaxID=1763543 RepID=A0A917U6G1_9ACTN|nr:cation:proton antiporter [Micromonospora sonchi]
MYRGLASDLAPLAVALPIVMACAVLVVQRWASRRLADLLAMVAAVAALGLSAALVAATKDGRVVTWSGGWEPRDGRSVGIVLVVDQLSAGFACLAAGLTCCALLYSWRYLEAAHGHYHALMLLFLAGMIGFVLTGDLFNMFVFFELMGVSAFALTGLHIEEPDSVQGSLNFALINSLGAYLSLMGIGLLYARTGQLGFAQLGAKLAGHPADGLIVGAFVLVTIGFLVKAAMAPMHFWLADAHAVAPTPVCVLMSGVMVEMGVYALARVYLTVFATSIPAPVVQRAFLTMGLLTAAVGSLMCFAQRHLKRLLAYSTIAHVGLFLIGFALLSPDGLAGVALYVVGHAGVKGALFLLVGLLLDRFQSLDEGKLFGRVGGRHPACWMFLLAALALAGLPPSGPGLGKAITEEAASAAGYPWLSVVFVLVSAVTGAAVLRAGLRVFLGRGHRPGPIEPAHQIGAEPKEPETEHPLRRTPLTMLVAIGALLAGSIVVGVVPALAQAVGRGAVFFSDQAGYFNQALFAVPAAPAPASAAWWSWSGILLGAASTVLAMIIAGISLHVRPPERGHFRSRMIAGVELVRRLHSGHIGDYVAWLLFGAAVLAALIGLPLLP